MIGFYPYIFGNTTTESNKSITALGTITRNVNVFTFSTGFIWKIENQTYQNTEPKERTPLPASNNNHRTDIFVLDTNNDIVLIPGEENPISSIAPIPPLNTIWLCSVDIIGDVFSEPYSPNGANMIFVKGDESANINFGKLQDAINSANALIPSINNPVIIICNSGFYLKEGVTIELNEEYVHLYSISGKADVFCNLIISNNNINVRGINSESFTITNAVTNVNVENCVALDNSFNLPTGSSNCSFTNCVGNDYCFSSEDNTIYNDCKANDFSFNFNQQTQGIYNNCVANSYSFGYIDIDGGVENHGVFNNCFGSVKCFVRFRFFGSLNNCTLKNDVFDYINSGNNTYKIINCTEINGNIIGNSQKEIHQISGLEYSCQRYEDIFIIDPIVELIYLNKNIQSNSELKTFIILQRTTNLIFNAGPFSINTVGDSEYTLNFEEVKSCIEFIWTGEMWFVKSIN